jgi:hypothetical protein
MTTGRRHAAPRDQRRDGPLSPASAGAARSARPCAGAGAYAGGGAGAACGVVTITWGIDGAAAGAACGVVAIIRGGSEGGGATRGCA